MNAPQVSISEAFDAVRLAQEKLDLMIHAYNQIEKNDGLGSETVDRFSDTAVLDADKALSDAKLQLAKTPGANAEEILRKVAVLVDKDNDALFVPIKAEIEAMLRADRATSEDTPMAVIGKDVMGRMSAHELYQFQDVMREVCDSSVNSDTLGDLAYDLHIEAWEELITRDPSETEDALAAVLALFNNDEFKNTKHGEQLQSRCVALLAKMARDRLDARLAAYQDKVEKAA